ncbi:Transmembrane protease serine 6 [Halocaridina rubra]|uniref:Transmembrane protease serine 6 n=1 Tax=Halocaridina rubra TaxID=373956 RepID=A0AAN8XKK9_HALRR
MGVSYHNINHPFNILGQFPWLVSVEATNFQEGWPLCGGILITEEWVLTAAHCLDSEKPEWLWVVSGEHDMEIDEGTEQYLLVDYFEQHEGYT